MKIQLLSNRSAIIKEATQFLIKKINMHTYNNPFVLGLSTGATVLSICENLVEYVQRGDVSLKNVVIFYAGEYVGFSQRTNQYYFSLLNDNFFSKVDLNPNNIYTLNGNAEDLYKECEQYEEKIKSFGGMDLFIGSLGVVGELAFNEPGSSLKSRTRLKTLTIETLKSDARFFYNDISAVPKQAITIGVGTIFDARIILIVAYGIHKAFAIKSCVESAVSEMNPASILQLHDNATVMVDKVAGRLLSAMIPFNNIQDDK